MERNKTTQARCHFKSFKTPQHTIGKKKTKKKKMFMFVCFVCIHVVLCCFLDQVVEGGKDKSGKKDKKPEFLKVRKQKETNTKEN